MKLLALAVLLVLGGCDLLAPEPDGTIVVTGRVVLAETGEPVVGLGVSLSQSVTWGSVARATTRTGGDGAFSFTYDAGPHGRLHHVIVNDEPYDPRYTPFVESAQPGKRTDLGVIELRLTDTP